MPREAGEVTATIICIGDELLIGQTVNTNASWIGEQLSLHGIRPVEVRTVGDDQAHILQALAGAATDVVLITGGLGPTKDDITTHVLCTFFGTRRVRRPEVEARIEAMFQRLGRPLSDLDRTQADLPEACSVIPNLKGTASGMWFERPREGGAAPRVYVSMPGVPYEMEAMMTAEVLPRLCDVHLPPTIVHRTLVTTGLAESHLAERIAGWEAGLAASGIRLAYLPSPGIVRLRLSTYAAREAAEATARVERKVAELRSLIPDLVFGEGTDRLEEVVGVLLRKAGQTLALAESCTGGYLSHLITGVPGSSAYYRGGVVPYTNAVKASVLGVPEAMLARDGAVSRPVVERMAEGARQTLRTDWGVALSGVAGPDGGTPETPVGTVWMAVAGPAGVRSTMVRFPGGRDLVIKRSAMAALNLLRKRLLEARG